MESYERLKTKKTDTAKIIEWHFQTILKNIKRRITFRQRYRNPWHIEVTERIQRDVFIASFKAIRDYTVQFGTTIDIDKDRKGIATKYTITFNHLGAFKFHIHKLSNIEKDKIVKQYFKKMSNNGVAEVSVTDNKVATIEYKCSTSTLKLKLSYTVKNNYGTICSF